MQRKLYLMKLMLKIEKNANEAIKQRIAAMGRGLHADNYAMRQLEQQTAQRQ